jgi:uracil phosphoribosyltransferase
MTAADELEIALVDQRRGRQGVTGPTPGELLVGALMQLDIPNEWPAAGGGKRGPHPYCLPPSSRILEPMGAPSFPNLTVLTHPLVQHKLSILRDRDTSTRDFKQLVSEMAMLMAYEVTKDMPTQPVEIETPLERTTGRQVSGKKSLVPILRPVSVWWTASPAHRPGWALSGSTATTPSSGGLLLPRSGGGGGAGFLRARSDAGDRRLGRGGSGRAQAGRARRIGSSAFAAPEGVGRMLEVHPEVPVFAASLDRQLNEHGYILPGLGDAGDRLFGTRSKE